MLTTELLLPRYRVIAPYPYCPFKVGTILIRVPDIRSEMYVPEDWKPGSPAISIEQIERCPTLIEKIHWSEQRTKEDFPEYVLYDSTCIPSKVLSVRCDEAGFVTEIETDAESGEYYRAAIWDFPATQEEYEQSKQQS